MVTVREKATVTQRIHGNCPTHSRTEISVRDVRTRAAWGVLALFVQAISKQLAHVRFGMQCVAKLDCSWRSGSAVNFGRALVQLSRVRP
jgi:hypothetical protein